MTTGHVSQSPVMALLICVSLNLGHTGSMDAAELRERTVTAFDDYVRAVEARTNRELASNTGFLGLDFQDPAAAPSIRRAVVSGQAYVSRLAERGRDAERIEVPDGLVHHWVGAMFVPGATIDQVLMRARSAVSARRADGVVEARELWRQGPASRVFLKLERKAIVTVTYNTVHDVQYGRTSETRAWSRSVSTTIAELESAGTPAEREKPAGQDRGFLWRLNSYWRYEQVPGGLIVELESLTLSRGMPALVRPLAMPIINVIARESIAHALESVRDKLTSEAVAPNHATERR
jgi:hypothetical protein